MIIDNVKDSYCLVMQMEHTSERMCHSNAVDAFRLKVQLVGIS